MDGAHKIRIDLIDIPEKRWRPIKKQVEDLAQSIMTYGQLQPIILQPNGERYTLVDGLHRITACQLNGMPEIFAVFKHELDPILFREIELEVNIQRIDMTWQEKQLAIAELHELKSERDPNWTQTRTAQVADTDQSRVAEALQYKKMAALFPEITTAKSMRQAMSWMKQKAKTVTRTLDVEGNIDYAHVEDKILLGDSVEVIKEIPDESFHLVLTDPPFGIGYDKRKAGTEGTISAYEDSEESYERLLSMAPDLYRVLKPDGWLIWFLGHTWYERAKGAFREAGFTVDEIPIVWDRSDGHCFTARPDRYFARAYDIALHCIKGNPEMIVRGKPNIIRATPVGSAERELLVERPVDLYRQLIQRLTLKGEKIADFFTGSGSVLAAAAQMQRDFFGVELDRERRATAIAKVQAHLPKELHT